MARTDFRPWRRRGKELVSSSLQWCVLKKRGCVLLNTRKSGPHAMRYGTGNSADVEGGARKCQRAASLTTWTHEAEWHVRHRQFRTNAACSGSCSAGAAQGSRYRRLRNVRFHSASRLAASDVHRNIDMPADPPLRYRAGTILFAASDTQFREPPIDCDPAPLLHTALHRQAVLRRGRCDHSVATHKQYRC
jgi:hypothetical protein